MSQARSLKMKEYFTQTTTHENIKPSDLSGDVFAFEERRTASRNRASPIRMNDTYRTTLTLGNERDETASNYNSIQNKVIDQQLVQKTEYFYHTRGGGQERFTSARGERDDRSLSSTPTNREISTTQLHNIAMESKHEYQSIREKCGQKGHGAKLIMNQEDREPSQPSGEE